MAGFASPRRGCPKADAANFWLLISAAPITSHLSPITSHISPPPFSLPHGSAVPTCALVVLTSVLLITLLVFTSRRKIGSNRRRSTDLQVREGVLLDDINVPSSDTAAGINVAP